MISLYLELKIKLAVAKKFFDVTFFQRNKNLISKFKFSLYFES